MARGSPPQRVPLRQVLHETALVEAFNLKAAVEFTHKNLDAAREALSKALGARQTSSRTTATHGVAWSRVREPTNYMCFWFLCSVRSGQC